jgi:hypothetical protein
MRVSLSTSEQKLSKELFRLSQILLDMPKTAASRYALTEIVLIRATAVFETVIADIAYKIACGARFATGAPDLVLVPTISLVAARNSMLTKGGTLSAARSNLSWSRAKHIAESVDGVLDNSGHFLTICRRHGSIIAEMFDVRNHAAHRNQSSKRKYLTHVRAIYGHERKIEVGRFLSTTNLLTVPKIDQYFAAMAAIVREIIAG